MSDTPFYDIMHMLGMCCHGEVILVTAPGPRQGQAKVASYSLALARATARWIDHGYEYEGSKLEER